MRKQVEALRAISDDEHFSNGLTDFIGVPKGIRTPVTAVKGRCPGPLDDGDGASDPNSLILVEPGGIEPPTSCMPCKRSPS